MHHIGQRNKCSNGVLVFVPGNLPGKHNYSDEDCDYVSAGVFDVYQLHILIREGQGRDFNRQLGHRYVD
jgi:hypothetical protein